MHASLAAFRTESLLWMQVAELSFDPLDSREHRLRVALVGEV
jgi:hypothetical protein